MSILCSISQSNPRGAAHACSGNSFRGGVSPRFTRRLKGQSTVEYVLIIAIIGLVVLIAGPWVSSAIRNQFNTVTDAIGSGTTGENFYEPEDIPDPQNGKAFAVYSEDDHSLMFYKRRGVPKVGDMFNYRRVTEVYTGIETETYQCIKSGSQYGAFYEDDAVVNTPWYGKRLDIKTVEVVDGGIRPNSVQYWFMNFQNCQSLKVNRLDTSRCTSLFCTFNRCKSATDIEVADWNVKNVTTMQETFLECHKLNKLDLSGWETYSNTMLHSTWNLCISLSQIIFGPGWNTSKVNDFNCTFFECKCLANLDESKFDTRSAIEMRTMFTGCTSLRIDCSDWNVSNVINHVCFNDNAPGVTAPRWVE